MFTHKLSRYATKKLKDIKASKSLMPFFYENHFQEYYLTT